MDKGAMTNIATGAASIAALQVWIRSAITFALKDAKGHTTMHMVRLTEATSPAQSDMAFTIR